MRKTFNHNLILKLFYILALLIVINCSSCQKDYNGTSGSISTQGQYGCSQEVFKIDFGLTQNVQLKWNTFDVSGEMPYCHYGNLKVKIGFVLHFKSFSLAF